MGYKKNMIFLVIYQNLQKFEKSSLLSYNLGITNMIGKNFYYPTFFIT